MFLKLIPLYVRYISIAPVYLCRNIFKYLFCRCDRIWTCTVTLSPYEDLTSFSCLPIPARTWYCVHLRFELNFTPRIAVRHATFHYAHIQAESWGVDPQGVTLPRFSRPVCRPLQLTLRMLLNVFVFFHQLIKFSSCDRSESLFGFLLRSDNPNAVLLDVHSIVYCQTC